MDACLKNKSQNFKGSYRDQECKPFMGVQSSVCRQCCYGDANCAADLAAAADGKGPMTLAAWGEDLLA